MFIRIAFLLTNLFIILSSCYKKNTDNKSLDSQSTLSFNTHIAPIIFENCVVCHRAGGAAPFSLETYEKVFRKKKTIYEVVSQNIMPPWPADPSYSQFVGERRLDNIDKQKILNWIEQGATEGNGALPQIPQFNKESIFGTPDHTFYFDSVLIQGNNKDRFLIAKVPIELPKKSFVRFIEFVPGKKQLVHHMNGHILNYVDVAKKNLNEGKSYIDVETEDIENAFNKLYLYNDDGTRPQLIHSASNYLPGAEATFYPEGIGGFTLNKKSIFVANDLHYGPSPINAWDRSKINIFLSKSPSQRPIRETMLGTNGIAPIIPPLVIPPDTVMTFRTQGIIPEDISLLTINPHLHLLGQSVKAFAIKPNGDTIPLIHIPQWDFRWQYFYTFKKMVKIPKGSLLVALATFNNTKDNPNNPNNPPQIVRERIDRGAASMRTTDEMFQVILTWLPYKVGDEEISLETDYFK